MMSHASFADDSLAGLLWQLYAQGSTGVFEASQGGQNVKIFIKHGAVIHAIGYQKEALLGFLLKNKGLISAAQLQTSLKTSQEQKIALGKVLVDQDVITAQVLAEIIQLQAEMILSHLYSWQEGRYEFRRSKIREDNIVPVKLNLIELAVAAARRTSDGNLFGRFVGDSQMVLRPRQGTTELALALEPIEQEILARMDGDIPLSDVMAGGGYPPDQFNRAVFILIIGGRLTARSPETVDSAADPEATVMGADSDFKQEVLGSLQELPPLLHTAIRAQQVLADPNAGFKEISTIIEEDQAMAVRILKVANSAFYGLVGQVSSVQHASVVLGHKTLSEIITAASASDYLVKALNGYDQDAETLWRHSLAVALGGKTVAAKRRPKLESDAFTAGLFHDMGKMILDSYIAERKEAFDEIRKQYGQDTTEAERNLFGFDHAELAADLCRQWNIPQSLGKAIKYHHFPEDSENNDLAHILHVANCWAHKLELAEDSDEDPMANVQEETYTALGVDEAGLIEILSAVSDSWESLASSI